MANHFIWKINYGTFFWNYFTETEDFIVTKVAFTFLFFQIWPNVGF